MDLQKTDKILINHIIDRKLEQYKKQDEELKNLLILLKRVIK